MVDEQLHRTFILVKYLLTMFLVVVDDGEISWVLGHWSHLIVNVLDDLLGCGVLVDGEMASFAARQEDADFTEVGFKRWLQVE